MRLGPSEANTQSLINPKKLNKKKYTNSGVLKLMEMGTRDELSFLHYIRMGCQMHFTLAVDFTTSNGDMKDQSSLHYIKQGTENEYMTAIRSIGEIVQDYDSDGLFPALGFGGKLSDGRLSHGFYMNGSKNNPNCQGVTGLLQAYYNAVNSITLHNITHLAPIINHVAGIAARNNDGRSYQILLMVTNGGVNDMDATKKAIVNAAEHPISIIIVGVGKEDFSDLKELDADSKRISYEGKVAERDIVQFVELRKFLPPNGPEDRAAARSALAKAVLEELPGQFMEWMRKHDAIKFSPCGKYLIVFSADQTCVEIYGYKGAMAANELLANCPIPVGDTVLHSDVPLVAHVLNSIFDRFFYLRDSVHVARGQEQLNRECSIFSNNCKLLIVGCSSTRDAGVSSRLSDSYRYNESLTPNPRAPLDDFSICVINLELGIVTDTLTFKNDKLFLSHNQCLSLYDDTLVILSTQHQTLHRYHLSDEGKFTLLQSIGRTCYADDDVLLDSCVAHNCAHLSETRAHSPPQAGSDAAFEDYLANLSRASDFRAPERSEDTGSASSPDLHGAQFGASVAGVARDAHAAQAVDSTLSLGAAPPGSAAVPPGSAAVPPGSAAVPPGSAAVPPGSAAVPPGSAAVPSSSAAEPSSSAAEPSSSAAEPSSFAAEPSSFAAEPSSSAAEPSGSSAVPEDPPAGSQVAGSAHTGGQPVFRAMQTPLSSSGARPAPQHDHKEGPSIIYSLKHRLLTLLHRVAEVQCQKLGSRQPMRLFCTSFDNFLNLRIVKMQLLDDCHVFIKYGSEDLATQRTSEPGVKPFYFALYNMNTTEMVGLYEGSSQQMMSIYERFTDFFRNARLPCEPNSICSPANNIHARMMLERQKATWTSIRAGSSREAYKRILVQLPVPCQNYNSSPYLDLSLFNYLDKCVSVIERPKATTDQPIRFYGRNSGLLKFTLDVGAQAGIGAHSSVPPRRLVAFYFHPSDPFAISVQKYHDDYVVNFHVRHHPT
ncbi:De-etiolated protein 1 Det1 [Trinorchestia longiramus]|nr:De-etiolated protein 1 Det1 [Trinorchestia longiramus]